MTRHSKIRSVFSLRILFILVSYFGLAFPSSGTAVLGGNITYKHVDSLIYDVDLTIYRDCRGIGFQSSVIMYVTCGSETPVSQTFTRIAISDVSPVCSRVTSPCTPSNTFGTGKGIEKHVYRKRIDLSKTAFNKITACGKVRFEYSNCCRTGSITTGAASSNTYLFAMLDLTKATANSSPRFENEPPFYVAINRGSKHLFKVKDRRDNDSFSFRLNFPMKSYKNYVSYSGSYSLLKPYTIYDPFKNGLIYPNADPPIGYYFDTIEGLQIFTPTSYEVTDIVIEVIEWRKDSSGKPQNIGITMIDYISAVEAFQQNNPPKVISPLNYYVCKGDSVTIDIETFDYTFVPPPPDTLLPDTLIVTWEYNDSSNIFGNLSILDTNDIHPTVRFTWRVPDDSATRKNNLITLNLNDNHCRYPIRINQTVDIQVLERPIQKYKVKSLACGAYALEDNSLHSGPIWDVLDTQGVPLRDTSLVIFSKRKTDTSFLRIDTLTIFQEGRYIIRLKSKNAGGCSEYSYDTIDVKVSSFELFSNVDSLLCNDWNFRLFPDGMDTSISADYRWSTSSLDTLPSISVERDTNDQVIDLTVTTTDGCVHSDQIVLINKYRPSIKLISDTTVCNPFTLRYDVNDLVDTDKLNTAFYWENGDTSRVKEISSAGDYYLSAKNYCGSDTSFIHVEAFNVPVLEPIPSFVACVPLDTILRMNDLEGPDNGPYTYRWSTKDTARQLNINEPGTYGYSIENICGSDSSSVTVLLLNAPDVNLGPDTLILSQIPDFELVADTIEGDYLWSTGDTTRSLHITSAGTYWVTVVNKCGSSSDTTTIQLLSVDDLLTDSYKIIPNPNAGLFKITGEDMNNAYVSMTDLTGRFVSVDQRLINGEIHLTISNPDPGIYFATIRTKKGTATLKVLVKI